MTRIITPWRKVAEEQNRIVLLSLFHIVCLTALGVGLHYTARYMRHPDRIILQDRSGSLYRGRTRPILCRQTAEDMARRAVFAFLDRSYAHENRAMCEAVFGKTAQKSLFELMAKSREEYAEQKIRQFPEILRMTVRPAEEKTPISLGIPTVSGIWRKPL